MGTLVAPPPQALAGRAEELERLLGVMTQAAAGRAAMILLEGEPGVGKTSLVRAVAALVADTMNIASGACLPLTSVSVPFLPLASAVRGWATTRSPTSDLDALTGNAAEIVASFDAWLDRRCAERPTLLVIDDVQWADQSSLDVLTYVLAGRAERRLAALLTVRNTDLHPGHRLHSWLADARRMPGFTSVQVAPLDRLGVADQIAGIFGRPARESLIDDVVSHGRGNPYLTRLLVENLPPDVAALPPTLPHSLQDAILGSWHALSAPARELTQLLAVGGPRLHSDQLGQVVATALGTRSVVPLLREATDAGLLEVHHDGSYWFRHPLQAELLEAVALPEQRAAWHRAYAVLFERTLHDHAAPLGRRPDRTASAVAVADHWAQTNQLGRAYEWALRAADAVAFSGGATEQLRLLDRALKLLPHALEADQTRVMLLGKIRDAAERAGKQEEELEAIELLLAEIDAQTSPLDAAALLVRRMDLRLSTGREFAGLEDVRRAVQLSAFAPESWQHALALAELAHAEIWHQEPGAAAHAEAAVVAARACGDAKSLSYALAAQSMALTARDLPGGEGPAEEAVQAALEAGDHWAFCHATLWSANAVGAWSNRRFVDHVGKRRDQLASLGASHTYVGWLSAGIAANYLTLGDWRQCVANLRIALGSSPGPMGEVTARLTAALLGALQGRPQEAQVHLYRAEELYAETTGFLAFEFDAVRAHVALAAGDPDAALAAALVGARAPGLPPTRCEWLLPLASRALADLAVRCRDERRSDAQPLDGLDALTREFPQVIADLGSSDPAYQRMLAALQGLYDAEVQRARAHPDCGGAWARAAEACARAELPWEEAYALWRAAESVLPNRTRRNEGTELLHRAHQLAAELRSALLLRELDGLARSARIEIPLSPGLAEATAPAQPDAKLPLAISGLTPREQEVLMLVAIGRTYSEIARALYISEKTVSVHISNLLRKTATTNRIELARLAQRAPAP